MDRGSDTAKRVIKALVPEKLLHFAWSRFLHAKSKTELSVASSLVSSPSKLDAIQQQYSSHNNERDFLTIDWLKRRISEIDDPALKSYFSVVAIDVTPSLCAPARCYRALINSVVAVSVQSRLQIGYMSQGNIVFISNYGQLLRDIESKPHVELRLVSNETELSVYLERWVVNDDVLTAPRPNPITRKIYLASRSATDFLETPGKNLAELYPTPLAEECTFDVDVVYTWVNFEDPDWQKMLAAHSDSPTLEASESRNEQAAVDTDRFLSRDELKYSLRSLLELAPWVRNVYVVTNCEPPAWFDEENPRVRWVYHEEIIDPDHLPTFNSHAIEASIHRVEGLSEHFLYFNDDLFFLKPVRKSDFFLPNGLPKVRPEPYGMVHGELDEDDPDYVNAARNVQALLQSEFGKTVTKLHTHSPQSMRLSVVKACEETFPEQYESVRSSKFRAITDISPTSFMYPNFAYLSGNAVLDYPDVSLVNVAKPYQRILRSYTAAMQSANHEELPLTLCINDGGGSAEDESWGETLVEFMRSAFSEISVAEKPFESFSATTSSD